MRLDIHDIVKACGGRLLNEVLNAVTVTSVSINSKTTAAGALFVPIVGDNFDGHDFISSAANAGAVCALTERTTGVASDIPLIYVKSTRNALMDLAGYYRRLFDIKVVAVTGSAGKTTTKDMIAYILARKFKTKKTMGNFNNEIGLPLSIFQLEPEDEMLVLEMGMNHAQEIHRLSLTGAPDISIITHIGDAHIENFENREGILCAKLEIVDGLKPDGLVILNGDDPLLTGSMAAEKVSALNVIYPSADNILESEPNGLLGSRCRFNWRGEDIFVNVPLPGGHMVKNALLAVVAGLEMGVSPEEVSKGFDDFVPPEGRLTIIEGRDKLIISDIYNSNPAAVREAIKVLYREKTASNRCVAILGDMGELGQVAEARHREVGEFTAEAGIDVLIAIGELSRYIYEGFSKNAAGVKCFYFTSVEDFLEKWQELLNPGDVVLVKASRSMKFEKITNVISE